MPLKSTTKKNLIAGYCEGKSENFCSVEHLKMMNKTIEERERERGPKTNENNKRQYFERDNNNEY
jgi:hypothetical protein